MKKIIAIVAGGYSREYDVSLRSAQGLDRFIDRTKYDVYHVLLTRYEWSVRLPDGSMQPIDRNNFSFSYNGQTVTFDFAYITVHGTPGEDGRLQGYFDMLQIPYSSCGTLASAMTFNKYTCTQFLKGQEVRVPDALRIRRGQTLPTETIVAQLGLPVFVKPNEGGSSLGTTKVKEPGRMQSAIHEAFDEADEVIIERFVPGIEVTCGCYQTAEKEIVFPLTEVVTDNDFFDYGAKYNGEVQEITPARIPDEVADSIRKETLRIYDLVGAKGVIRVDFIIPSDGKPVMLEINTTPGMTSTSFIPQQVRAAGLNMTDVTTEIIENELKQITKRGFEQSL